MTAPFIRQAVILGYLVLQDDESVVCEAFEADGNGAAVADEGADVFLVVQSGSHAEEYSLIGGAQIAFAECFQ